MIEAVDEGFMAEWLKKERKNFLEGFEKIILSIFHQNTEQKF